jgi:beta-glucanase (GH16 family)
MEFGYWERDSIGGLEWTQDAITFSVDGEEFGTLENNGGLPFNKDFFMILNVAMGGNFGGEINPAFTGSSMEVDYIRVYQ